MTNSIRWQQRFSNYDKALQQLESAIVLAQSRPLSDLEKQGIIQAFEFTHELAWNVMKDYFQFQGNSNIMGSRDAIREAFSKGLINNGERWMETISSRNKTSHTYNHKIADEMVESIIQHYGSLFRNFAITMQKIKDSSS